MREQQSCARTRAHTDLHWPNRRCHILYNDYVIMMHKETHVTFHKGRNGSLIEEHEDNLLGVLRNHNTFIDHPTDGSYLSMICSSRCVYRWGKFL